MQYIASVRAALRAAAPVVAIPIEGRAPVCIRARLLKGALKGVTIHSVTVLDDGRLRITGMAGMVRTSCTFIPMRRYDALTMIDNWADAERRKRVKELSQGILSTKEQRALKLKKAEGEWIAVVAQAHKDVESIYRQAREHTNPVLTSASEERREDVIREYREFRSCRSTRKHGAVIRWKIAEARKQLDTVSVMRGKRRERKRRYAKSAKHVPAMLYLMGEIARLEGEYKALVPPVWMARDYIAQGGYWVDPWITRRPKVQTCYGRDYWRDDEDHYNRKALAEELKEARANIRALTPPAEETEPEEMPIAA